MPFLYESYRYMSLVLKKVKFPRLFVPHNKKVLKRFLIVNENYMSFWFDIKEYLKYVYNTAEL